MNTTLLLIAGLLTTAGCLSTETEATPPVAASEQALEAAREPVPAVSSETSCGSFQRRARACTATFIPALVDARVQRDEPPGIAREGQRPRAELVQQAFSEWEQDSRDAAIDALCADIAQSITPEKDAALRTSLGECLAKSGCDEFVRCAVPVSLTRWKS